MSNRCFGALLDNQLKEKLCEHVSGSLLNFLEHASPGGQIPIMITADDPDPFRIVGKNTTSRNQAKPVFGQLGLLACDQRGDANWLEPHFDSILRFYDSWIGHNSSSAELARRLGRSADHIRLVSQAKDVAQRIQTFCWDPRDSYYYTVDVQCVDRRAELIPTVPRGMNVVEMPPDENPDVYRLPAALVRHRASTERTEPR